MEKGILITITVLTILLASCSKETIESKEANKSGRFTVSTTNGSGMSTSNTRICCDSFQFESKGIVYIWVDGGKMKIVADKIHVYDN